jgi:DNA-binding transcriptional ArsR family regulator
MPRTTLDLVDPRIAKALSHPMRARILVILNERVASPNEIAEEIGERLPNVSYHVRALQDLGCIELVDTAQRRGAIEHYYRAIVRPYFSERDWKRLPLSGRQAISGTALQVIWADVADAVNGGTFDARSERYLTNSTFTLDDEGWSAMTKLLDATLAEAEKIASKSAARLRKADSEGGTSRLVLMHFESPAEHAQES